MSTEPDFTRAHEFEQFRVEPVHASGSHSAGFHVIGTRADLTTSVVGCVDTELAARSIRQFFEAYQLAQRGPSR